MLDKKELAINVNKSPSKEDGHFPDEVSDSDMSHGMLYKVKENFMLTWFQYTFILQLLYDIMQFKGVGRVRAHKQRHGQRHGTAHQI